MFFSKSEVWGHRGWPSRYPDNTAAGIRAAAEVAAGVEIDVRCSVDGRLVLSHDPALGGKVVAETEWRDLASVDLWGHRPTLLSEVLGVAVPLDLEVKNDPTEPDFDPSHRVARMVADHARTGDVVTSFWWPSMDAVKLTHANVTTGLLCCHPVDPMDAIRHAVDGGHGVVAPEHVQITAEVVAFAVVEGLDVVAWTVDDPADASRLADLGVDAIISNRPGELIAESPPPRTHQ
jgi:glycerophosphoryl diester phosphodiesterase